MPTDLTPEARQTLRRLEKTAHKDPWVADSDGLESLGNVRHMVRAGSRLVVYGQATAGEAEFIAAAANAALPLLDALEAAEAERDRLRKALQPFAAIAAALPADAEDDGWLANCLTEFNDPLVASVRRAAAALRPE